MKLYCLHTDIGPGENCYGDYINLIMLLELDSVTTVIALIA